MKTQHEATIQFSGYPLSIVEADKKVKRNELALVRPIHYLQIASPKSSIANDPRNWDIDWFNSYE